MSVLKHFSFPFFHANVPVPDVLVCVVAAPVHLQRDASGIRMAFFGICEFHKFNAIDPGCNFRRIAFNLRSQFVPFSVLPELRPVSRFNRAWDQSVLCFDLCHGIQEVEVSVMNPTRQTFAVDPGQIAVVVVIDHVLVGLTSFIASQEQATVGTIIVLHFDDYFEIAELSISENDSAVAGNVLATNDRALFQSPATTTRMHAGAAMASLSTDVPALERLAVENRFEG